MQVPAAAHPAWSDLLTGKSQHQPSFLAARMLVVRARMDVLKTGSRPEAVRRYATELRELFAQNADCRSAQQDLAKIFG